MLGRTFPLRHCFGQGITGFLLLCKYVSEGGSQINRNVNVSTRVIEVEWALRKLQAATTRPPNRATSMLEVKSSGNYLIKISI